ncbi:MAG: gfo/Idh/MocA family oxidoreductase, partial [Planctomycetes bacterium]|nr:gfo/Idh/MocA family oxidoreductase [Planctomycetota bacterium]
VETFSQNSNTEYEERAIATEDWGAVLFRMDNGVHGVFYVSQVSAGRKCHLNFEIDGSQASLYWNQEQADLLWTGYRDRDNSLSMRNPLLMDPAARHYNKHAAGNPEAGTAPV